jgi:putative ABC transport system substrate-binding protein
MIDRRTFLAGTGAVLLTTPLTVEAQPSGKTARVGFLQFGGTLGQKQIPPVIVAELRERGWIEGKNLVLERRTGESTEQLHAAAAELGRLKVDVLVVPSAGTARIAQAEAKNTSIVIIAAGDDLARQGLVASLARPGGNITGLQILQDEVFGKRLQLLKEVRPNLSRVAFLDESVTHGVGSHASKEEAARSLGLELHVYIATRPEDFPVMIDEMAKKGVGGLIIESTPLTGSQEKRIIDSTIRHRIVAVHSLRRFVEAGGLMSYGADLNEMFRRTAVFIDKILTGAKPADLPVEQPTKFELVINLKTVKALGLTIPPSLLGRADEVIQ